MKLNNYSEADFIADETFVHWAKGTDPGAIAFWEKWLIEHPEKREEAVNAAQFIQSLQIRETTFTDSDTLHAWKQVQSATAGPKSVQSLRPGIGVWYRVAAVTTGILLIAFAWFLIQERDTGQNYVTQFGQTRSITLPDGSKVVLNGNSTLRFKPNWSKGTRQVWLNGEAFLHVRKMPGTPSATFVVHTGDLDIEVLGTQFDVRSRRGNTKVVLAEGKVRLHRDNGGRAAQLIMHPGEMAELAETHKEFIKYKVNPDVYTSWKSNRLIFIETPVAEIVRLLEDNYGLQVTFTEPAMQKRKLSGEIKSTDADVLLAVLAGLLDTEVSRRGNQVIFSSPLP